MSYGKQKFILLTVPWSVKPWLGLPWTKFGSDFALFWLKFGSLFLKKITCPKKRNDYFAHILNWCTQAQKWGLFWPRRCLGQKLHPTFAPSGINLKLVKKSPTFFLWTNNYFLFFIFIFHPSFCEIYSVPTKTPSLTYR